MSLLKANAVQLGQSITATNNFVWYQPASPDGTVRLGNGNSGSVTDLVTVNSSGNVGIGVSPTSLLTTVSSGQVQIGTTSWPTSFVGKSNARTLIGNEGVVVIWNEAAAALGNAATIYLGPKGSGTNGSTIIAGGAIAGVSESNSTNNGALTFATNGGSGNGERMRLDSSGNLGLGVTPSGWGSGSKALQIGVAFGLRSTTSAGYEMYGNAYNNGTNDIYLSSNYATKYQTYNGQHLFFTAASGTAGNAISFTQAMTLDASGNLGVGTTSPSAFGKLASVQSGNNVNLRVENGSASFAEKNIWSTLTGGSNTNTTAIHYAAYTGSGNVFYVYGNGNVQNTNNSYGAISDKRLKENIVDATPKLNDLLKVRIRNFNFKNEQTHKQIGVVAQELEEVFPSMIEENADGLKGVKYSVFIPILVKAIQELHQEIETLKAKVK